MLLVNDLEGSELVKDRDPWCNSSGNRFGTWVRLVFSAIRASICRIINRPIGLFSDCNRTDSEFSSPEAQPVSSFRRISLDYLQRQLGRRVTSDSQLTLRAIIVEL